MQRGGVGEAARERRGGRRSAACAAVLRCRRARLVRLLQRGGARGQGGGHGVAGHALLVELVGLEGLVELEGAGGADLYGGRVQLQRPGGAASARQGGVQHVRASTRWALLTWLKAKSSSLGSAWEEALTLTSSLGGIVATAATHRRRRGCAGCARRINRVKLQMVCTGQAPQRRWRLATVGRGAAHMRARTSASEWGRRALTEVPEWLCSSNKINPDSCAVRLDSSTRAIFLAKTGGSRSSSAQQST